MCGKRLRNGWLLLVLLLGLSAPLSGVEPSLETVTLTAQEWASLKTEWSGLSQDLTELALINKRQQSLIIELETLQQSNESLLQEQAVLLTEQQSELAEWETSSTQLINDIARQEARAARWKTTAIVTGSVASAAIITVAVLLLVPGL